MSATENSAAPTGNAPASDPTIAQPQTQSTAVAQPTVGGNELICQWQGCGERQPTPEQLYDHVCERHVGRKSTNNLNLTCQWGNCRTTTVKRDHITSHIRVHVPLKPHKCDFCGKAFKRPQDLKKHVKTHADDSVLLRSPEPNRQGHGGAGGGYQGQAGKLVADLQSLAATASGYYPHDHGVTGQPMYGYPSTTTNQSAYHGASAPQQGSAYGPVYYAVSQPSNANAEYELRKRAAFDALNEFFGDAKRRLIDPTTYYDVGQRLASLNTVQLPMLAGYSGGGVSDYSSGPAAVASATQPLLQQQYSLPIPNLRTKSDLLNIDHFLEQLQSTVYENSSQAAAAGVAQAGSHYVHTGVNYRTSNSPPSLHPSSHANPASSHATAVTPINATAATETPALTPASSVLSYQSANSPSSVHSGQTVSPVARSTMGGMYPTLPAVSTITDISGSYVPTSTAPASGLASAFDADGRRRYSAGNLQKAQPMDTDETSSPTTSSRAGSSDTLPKVEKLGLRSPAFKNVDPALRSPSSEVSNGQDEAWVENVRLIEALRMFIKEKLEKGDYEDDEVGSGAACGQSEAMETNHDQDAKNLYPVIKELQDYKAEAA